MIPHSISPKHSKTRISSALYLAGLAAMLSLSASAHASSIVADGGFESAGGGNVYFAGQTIDGNAWNVTQGAVYIDTLDPYVFDGANALNLTGANLYVPNAVSQVLTTVAGQTYFLSFWANADISNVFAVTENGAVVAGTPSSIAANGFPGAVTNSGLFTDYTGKFVATSASTTLSFADTGNPAIGSANYSVIVDDVTVQPVPEPGSLVLLLTGVVSTALTARRKLLGRSA